MFLILFVKVEPKIHKTLPMAENIPICGVNIIAKSNLKIRAENPDYLTSHYHFWGKPRNHRGNRQSVRYKMNEQV